MFDKYLERALFGIGGRIAMPGGRRGRLSILIFHSVVPEPDPWRFGSVSAGDFERITSCISRYFSVLPLPEAIARLKRGQLPPRSVAITFDDGYRDNAEVALPVLQRHRLSATFFIATGFLDGGMMWNDMVIEAYRQTRVDRLRLADPAMEETDLRTGPARLAACRRTIRRLKYLPPEKRADAVAELVDQAGADLSARLMMDRKQIVQLAEAGMSIGAHTVNHPILARLSEPAAEREIREGRHELGSLLGREITLFAYPNGKPGEDYTQAHVEIVHRCGFEAAVTTSPGSSHCGSDPFQLPRYTPWDKGPLRFGLRLLANARRSAITV